MFPMLDLPTGRQQYTIVVRSGAKKAYLQFPFSQMTAPFDDTEHRNRLIDFVNDKLGTRFDYSSKVPSLAVAEVTAPDKLDGLLAIVDYIVQRSMAAGESGIKSQV
jgi:hypothetical protein